LNKRGFSPFFLRPFFLTRHLFKNPRLLRRLARDLKLHFFKLPFCQLNDKEMCIFYFFPNNHLIILKQLFTSGSVIIVNKNLDFVSAFIHR
jgi:hypothetical protein